RRRRGHRGRVRRRRHVRHLPHLPTGGAAAGPRHRADPSPRGRGAGDHLLPAAGEQQARLPARRDRTLRRTRRGPARAPGPALTHARRGPRRRGHGPPASLFDESCRPTEEPALDTEITPFRIEIPQPDLADLRARLAATRWPDAETVDDWSQGVPLAYLRDLCGYWADGYDWRATEARLNALSQYRTEIDGTPIHFLHIRSPHADALPLLVTHGWPGTFAEFEDIVAPLTNPSEPGDAFHLVCPSLPGFGFSGRPRRSGIGVERIAGLWAALMRRLGYDRFAAHGGDFGSF